MFVFVYPLPRATIAISELAGNCIHKTVAVTITVTETVTRVISLWCLSKYMLKFVNNFHGKLSSTSFTYFTFYTKSNYIHYIVEMFFSMFPYDLVFLYKTIKLYKYRSMKRWAQWKVRSSFLMLVFSLANLLLASIMLKSRLEVSGWRTVSYYNLLIYINLCALEEELYFVDRCRSSTNNVLFLGTNSCYSRVTLVTRLYGVIDTIHSSHSLPMVK